MQITFNFDNLAQHVNIECHWLDSRMNVLLLGQKMPTNYSDTSRPCYTAKMRKFVKCSVLSSNGIILIYSQQDKPSINILSQSIETLHHQSTIQTPCHKPIHTSHRLYLRDSVTHRWLCLPKKPLNISVLEEIHHLLNIILIITSLPTLSSFTSILHVYPNQSHQSSTLSYKFNIMLFQPLFNHPSMDTFTPFTSIPTFLIQYLSPFNSK